MATKAKQLTSDTSLLAGIQKRLPTGTLTILTQAQTGAQVAAVLQTRISKAQAVIAARSALHEAVLDSDEEYAQTDAYVQSVRQSVQAMYGNSPTILADFGEVPKKAPTPLTATAKVVAAAKRAATRKARGTTSKRAKQAIVGALSGPVVVSEDGTVTDGSSGASTGGSSTSAASPAAPSAASNGSSASSSASHS
jgi:hypothetical protein